MISYVEGNVVNIKPEVPTAILHVVNDGNSFGSGVAAAIKNKFPFAAKAYHDWYQEMIGFYGQTEEDDAGLEAPFKLGQILPVKVANNIEVVHMIGQSEAGGHSFKVNGKTIYLRPIRLQSLAECLYRVAEYVELTGVALVAPRFGSLRAGGKWDEEIVPIIEEVLTKNNIDITIYDYKE